MNRRSFLKTLSMAGALPALSGLPATALGSLGATPASAVAVSPQTYKWAEMLVRTHNKCNLTMLQRLLGLDQAAAAALKAELLKNGVITGAKTAYGMHQATKPLYQELMPQPKHSFRLPKAESPTQSSVSENGFADDKTLNKKTGNGTGTLEDTDPVPEIGSKTATSPEDNHTDSKAGTKKTHMQKTAGKNDADTSTTTG